MNLTKMKPIISLYIAALALFTFSCDERNTATLAPEYLYDAGNQKVIKSILNNKKSTVAMLYGNDLAWQVAQDTAPEPTIGAHYTLVTWKQKPMPQWYGTSMNGAISSIEHVRIVHRNGGEAAFEYNFQTGPGYKSGDGRPEKDQRIRWIVSQQAAVFP
jgi:hypothetical protein